MITNTTQSIQDFITDNRLKKPDGTIAFRAVVKFYQNGSLQQIHSEIQVITIPGIMAVYVIEFFNEAYGLPDMYSTDKFMFKYKKGLALEIGVKVQEDGHIISILPLNP